MSIEIDQDSSPEQEQDRALYTPLTIILTVYSPYNSFHHRPPPPNVHELVPAENGRSPNGLRPLGRSLHRGVVRREGLRRVGQARALGELGLLRRGGGETGGFSNRQPSCEPWNMIVSHIWYTGTCTGTIVRMKGTLKVSSNQMKSVQNLEAEVSCSSSFV